MLFFKAAVGFFFLFGFHGNCLYTVGGLPCLCDCKKIVIFYKHMHVAGACGNVDKHSDHEKYTTEKYISMQTILTQTWQNSHCIICCQNNTRD